MGIYKVYVGVYKVYMGVDKGYIYTLFDGLAYNTCGYFAHCSYFSSPLRGSEKYNATRKISARITLNHRTRGLLFHYKKNYRQLASIFW